MMRSYRVIQDETTQHHPFTVANEPSAFASGDLGMGCVVRVQLMDLISQMTNKKSRKL